MLTPSPVFPRRVWVVNRRVGRGLAGAVLPSTGTFHAGSGGGTFYPLMRYRGIRGLGQEQTDTSIATGDGIPLSTAPDITTIDFPTTGGNAPNVTYAPPVQGPGLLQTLMPAITAGVKVGGTIATNLTSPSYLLTKQALSTPGVYYSSPGGVVATGGASPLTTTQLSSMMPILLVVGGVVVMMMFARK